MADAGDVSGVAIESGAFLATGLPVYTIANEIFQSVAKKHLGASDEDAKAIGRVGGAITSMFTTIFTGMS